MNVTRDRLRSFGWAFVLTLCFALTVALMFRVNAVKSQVRLAERQIVELRQQKLFLETEFETRASQQQLRSLNDIEFGYAAPTARQYLEGERQLAAFGKARAADAPAPIRVASAASEDQPSLFPEMVSPLSGKALAAEMPADARAQKTAGLDDHLSHIAAREALSQ